MHSIMNQVKNYLVNEFFSLMPADEILAFFYEVPLSVFQHEAYKHLPLFFSYKTTVHNFNEYIMLI